MPRKSRRWIRATFHAVSGADHNSLYAIGGAAYFQRLKQFVEEVTAA